MKRALLATAVGLTFIGASAQVCLAQTGGRAGGDTSAQNGQPSDQASPSGDQDARSGRHWRHERRGDYMGNEGAEAGGPDPRPDGPPPGPPGRFLFQRSNAAHFVFQRGHARIDITCPQFFALRDCIQAATELLDKIHSLRGEAQLPGAGGLPTPQPTSPGASGGLVPRSTSPGAGGLPTPRPSPGSGGGLAPAATSPAVGSLPTPQAPSPGTGSGLTPQAASPGAGSGLAPHAASPGTSGPSPGAGGDHRM